MLGLEMDFSFLFFSESPLSENHFAILKIFYFSMNLHSMQTNSLFDPDRGLEAAVLWLNNEWLQN